MNNQHKPFDDPRVRRALHLVFDKVVLVDLIQETARHAGHMDILRELADGARGE